MLHLPPPTTAHGIFIIGIFCIFYTILQNNMMVFSLMAYFAYFLLFHKINQPVYVYLLNGVQ